MPSVAMPACVTPPKLVPVGVKGKSAIGVQVLRSGLYTYALFVGVNVDFRLSKPPKEYSLPFTTFDWPSFKTYGCGATVLQRMVLNELLWLPACKKRKAAVKLNKKVLTNADSWLSCFDWVGSIFFTVPNVYMGESYLIFYNGFSEHCPGFKGYWSNEAYRVYQIQ